MTFLYPASNTSQATWNAVLTALLAVVVLTGCDATAPEPTADAKPAADGFLIRTLNANGQSSEHRQEKVAVCHYDDEADTYKRIEVGAPALDAHLGHGDGVPGGEVPGAEVPSAFDDDCAVVPLEFTCEVRYGTELGQPTVTIVGRTTVFDPEDIVFKTSSATIGNGPDGVAQTGISVSGFVDDGAVITAMASELPNDDNVALTVVLFATDDAQEFTCGPYPVVP